MAIQDLKASLDLKQNLNIYTTCKQFDNLNLILSIYDNSLQADLTNYDVRLRAMKADNVPLIQQHIGIDIDGNVVNIQADEQLTTTAGKTPIELQFINKSTGKKKATFNLVLIVFPSTLNINGTISTATYTLLEELEAKLDQASDFLENIDEAIEANTNLENTIANSETAKSNLDGSINVGNTLKTDLNNIISTGNTLKTNLENDISTGNTLKSNLEETISAGDSLLSSLETFELEHADVTDISNQLAGINADLSDIVQEQTTQNNNIASKANQSDLAATNTVVANKAEKKYADNIQTQVNNLVLGAVGAGNNAEVIQARGDFSLLNNRLESMINPILTLNKSKNLYRSSEDIANTGLGNDGTVYSSYSGFHTGYIPANEGDIITASRYLNGTSISLPIRFATAYDSNKTLLPSSGANNIEVSNKYIVPSGVSFVILTFQYVNINGGYALQIEVTNDGIFTSYEAYQEPYYKKIDDEIDEKRLEEEYRTFLNKGIVECTFEDGKYYYYPTKSYMNDINFGVVERDCTEGDVFILTTDVGGDASSIHSLIILDVSGSIIDHLPLDVYAFKYYKVPVNGVKVIISARIGTGKKYSVLRTTDKYLKIQGSFDVLCAGDSLTMGAWGNGTYYPQTLQNLIPHMNVKNMGYGGEATPTIISRLIGFNVAPFTIPSNTTPVQITLSSYWGDLIAPLVIANANGYTIEPGINPVTINGIKGTISLNDGIYYFTRSTSGDVVNITRPTKVYTNILTTSAKNPVLIIWTGTNGTPTTDIEIKKWIGQQKEIIKAYNSNRFIIIGLTYDARTNLIALNDTLLNEFGENFLNIHDYIVKYGLNDAGITATTNDTTAISNNNIPPSLLYDNVHFIGAGYNVIANQVYKKGQELGYWS